MKLRNAVTVMTVVLLLTMLPVITDAGHLPFPSAGIDVFKSIFAARITVIAGPLAGTEFMIEDVVAPRQVVIRGEPFFDSGPGVDDVSPLPIMPPGFDLPTIVRDSDIPLIPPGFNETFDESVHMQMSLDARTSDGSVRILVGQPLKDEFPSLFQPSFGIAVSVAHNSPSSGFPARSVFNPFALIQTPFGDFVGGAPGFVNAVWSDVIINSFPQEGGVFVDFAPSFLVLPNDLDGPPVAVIDHLTHTVQLIPEPSSLLLFAVGILGIIGMGYRRRKKAA